MNGKRGLSNIFPLLNSISPYPKGALSKDLFAGLTVGIVLIPQAMAYAMLAGVPPIYGLYAGLVPLLIYALLGSSRQLSIGPVAVSSILVLAGISAVATPFSEGYISLAILTGILAGVLQFGLGLMRLGFLVNFLSRPVIAGFSSAAAIIIAISQFKDVFGFTTDSGTSAQTLWLTIQNIGNTHGLTLIVALGSFVLLLGLRFIHKKIPAALIIAALGTILSAYFGWADNGLAIIGDIPNQLPSFVLPTWSIDNIRAVIPTALTVGIIGMVEVLSIGKLLETKTKNHTIEPNRELIAVGLSKVIGGFFQAVPSSGSFSRSAINNDSRSHSQMSSIITFLLIGMTLLFFTPLFYYLPKAVLAAIILQSILGLFEWQEAKHLWQVHRSDFWMMATTFLITLAFGIEEGVFSGVILSILMVLYKSTKPHVAQLGNIPDTPFYRNIDRYDESLIADDLLILRFDDQLYYGNASFFKEFIQSEITGRENRLRYILLDASNIHNMDSSGAHALQDIENYLADHDIALHLSAARGPLRDMLAKCGMMNEPHKHHMTTHAGVQTIKGLADDKILGMAVQKNT